MKVSVAASKKAVQTHLVLDLPEGATVRDLKAAFHAAKKAYYPSRQSFKDANGTKYSSDDKSLASYGYKEGTVLLFKDLGPQIGYRTVFVLEYLGPILIMCLFALRPSIIFGAGASSQSYNYTAKLGLACWFAHFLKREFETFFVHKFSRPTMPLSNLYKNCWYYWGFALAIGYPLCKINYTSPTNQLAINFGLAMFTISEIGNLICHIMLSTLRPADGAKVRPIPKGFLFGLVSCPNYFFEIAAWVGFSIMTAIPVSWLFTIIGGLQMLQWAQSKHKGYLKDYGDEYKKLHRKAMIPFLL